MGTDKTSLGDRMKGYEDINRAFLTRRMPCIIRIDGKAFHTLTRGLKKPFDEAMRRAMEYTAGKLVENIQGCKLAYTQSDEISLFLCDYTQLTTDAWFDKNLQKMASVSASIATAYFNAYVMSLVSDPLGNTDLLDSAELLRSKMPAMFDARVFVLPKEEVCNYFIWRQQDAVRNSIQGLGQANFSQKELSGVSCNEIQEKLWQEKQLNWNDTPTMFKRGFCVLSDGTVDLEIPTFTEDRNYIEQHVFVGE